MEAKLAALISQVVTDINTKYASINASYAKHHGLVLNRNLRKFKSPVDEETEHLVQQAVNQYLRLLRANEITNYIDTIDNVTVYQRSKNPQRAENKVQRWNTKSHITLGKYLNDLRGYRLIMDGLRDHEASIIHDVLEPLKANGQLHHYYVKDGLEKNGQNHYHAIHCYIQSDNHYFPWELQLWDSNDADSNYQEHANYETETRV